MLVVGWVQLLKLLSAMPRMNILLRPSPNAVVWRMGCARAMLSSEDGSPSLIVSSAGIRATLPG